MLGIAIRHAIQVAYIFLNPFTFMSDRIQRPRAGRTGTVRHRCNAAIVRKLCNRPVIPVREIGIPLECAKGAWTFRAGGHLAVVKGLGILREKGLPLPVDRQTQPHVTHMIDSKRESFLVILLLINKPGPVPGVLLRGNPALDREAVRFEKLSYSVRRACSAYRLAFSRSPSTSETMSVCLPGVLKVSRPKG